MVRSIKGAGFSPAEASKAHGKSTKADHFVFTLSSRMGKVKGWSYAAKMAQFHMVWLCLARGFEFQKGKLERKPVTETGDVRREE
jgi:hypothetical protein